MLDVIFKLQSGFFRNCHGDSHLAVDWSVQTLCVKFNNSTWYFRMTSYDITQPRENNGWQTIGLLGCKNGAKLKDNATTLRN